MLAVAVGQSRNVMPFLGLVRSRAPAPASARVIVGSIPRLAIVSSEGLPFPRKLSRPSCGEPFWLVGNNEDSSTQVRSSNVGCCNPQGAGSVTEQVQAVADPGQPASLAARDVFDDDPGRPHFFDNAGEVVPEAAALASHASPFPSGRDVLAGEPSANKVNVRPVALRSDILVPRRCRPVLLEHGAAEGIDLALPHDRAEPRALES